MDAIATPRPEDGWRVPWDAVQGYDWVQAWKGCQQDPVHHAEGDVWIHTEMVLGALVTDPAWRALAPADRDIAYLAALLHDVAKPTTTRVEDDGRVTARGHSRRGAVDARRILWELGYPFATREAVCALIACHQVPFFLLEDDAPLSRLARLSQTARCDLLEIVARADIRGRVCQDERRVLDNIELFGLYAREQGCAREPLAFPSDHARFRFFRGGGPVRDVYDDTRCEVTLMCGLPGAGKTTWIARCAADLPRISLDEIRRELGVRPTDNQGEVRRVSLERARELLRAGEPFVWDATNLAAPRRARLIDLCDDYRARVRIVYVEAPASRLWAQNASRADAAVPTRVIRDMMRNWHVPDRTEAHRVDYALGDGDPGAGGVESAAVESAGAESAGARSRSVK